MLPCREYGHLQISCPRNDHTFDNANSDTENYISDDETKNDIEFNQLNNDVVQTLTALTDMTANYVTTLENYTLPTNAQNSALSASPQIINTKQDESQVCSTPNTIKSYRCSRSRQLQQYGNRYPRYSNPFG